MTVRDSADATHSRRIASIIGLAVGDAVGTTVEFEGAGTFVPLTDMVGGGPFSLPVGAWTDDTSMALCLAASLVECGGFDLADQMRRYVRWWREGYWSSTDRCFDIGITTREALTRFESNGNALAGSTDPRSAGNGSVMRLAPVVAWAAADLDEAVRPASALEPPYPMATRRSTTNRSKKAGVDCFTRSSNSSASSSFNSL